MNTALKYGVSLYSYTDDLTTVMNLEDAFDAISDLGATGIEILGEAHVPGYPAPSAAWIDRWFSLLEQFRLEPTNYGSWIDTRLHHARSMTARRAPRTWPAISGSLPNWGFATCVRRSA